MTRQNKRTYQQHCGVAAALDLVGERWTLLIVRDLLLGPRRYTDLHSGLPGLTTNLLARRLKDMERDGLIQKVKLPAPASSVVYCLTPLGEGLEPVVLAACEWGTRFLEEPGEEEHQDLGWLLLRLKRVYRGGYQLTFEIHAGESVFHVTMRPDELQPRVGTNPESELKISGDLKAIRQMFFGPMSASETVARGDIVVEGKFGRWPRVLAAFGLR